MEHITYIRQWPILNYELKSLLMLISIWCAVGSSNHSPHISRGAEGGNTETKAWKKDNPGPKGKDSKKHSPDEPAARDPLSLCMKNLSNKKKRGARVLANESSFSLAPS